MGSLETNPLANVVELNMNALRMVYDHIPTGIAELDQLISGDGGTCRGLPKGRITQVWGQEDTYKTTAALLISASVIRQGGSVAYIDWDNDVVPDWAGTLGVPVEDTSKFELYQPVTLEEGIKIATAAIRAGVGLIVFDCVNSAIPEKFFGAAPGEAPEGGAEFLGEQHRVWGHHLSNLKMWASRDGGTILGTAVVRHDQELPNTGMAWRFDTGLRLYATPTDNPGIVKWKAVKSAVSMSQGQEVLLDFTKHKTT